ncbi:hypothetical protein PM082_018001 [Marasmius tenuissimus]|nr:hypothetical protein PM082_018001 [Marasmius tenuissimus]
MEHYPESDSGRPQRHDPHELGEIKGTPEQKKSESSDSTRERMWKLVLNHSKEDRDPERPWVYRLADGRFEKSNIITSFGGIKGELTSQTQNRRIPSHVKISPGTRAQPPRPRHYAM